MNKKIEFETFNEFCSRADEILEEFLKLKNKGRITYKQYSDYIYNEHKFSNNEERDYMIKDKCYQWILSKEYEPMNKNDLYCVLGYLRKGK